MERYIPSLGDVIYDNNVPVVVISIDNNEDIASCTYNRDYFICDEGYIRENQGVTTMEELKRHGRKVEIRGSVFPPTEKVIDAIPYKIEKINAIRIKQKVAKTITVFE